MALACSRYTLVKASVGWDALLRKEDFFNAFRAHVLLFSANIEVGIKAENA